MIRLLHCLCMIVALALLPVHAAGQRLPVPDRSAPHAGMAGMKCGTVHHCPETGAAQQDCCSPSLPVLPVMMPGTAIRPAPPAMATLMPTPAGRTWAPPERPPRG